MSDVAANIDTTGSKDSLLSGVEEAIEAVVRLHKEMLMRSTLHPAVYLKANKIEELLIDLRMYVKAS